MNTLLEKISTINDMILQGKALEAFDQFYHDDVVMQENNNPIVEGKVANRQREEDFFGAITEFRGAQPLKVTIGENTTMVEWHFDKMKNSIKNIATLIMVAFMTFSFTTVEGDKKTIKAENSKVLWKGYKVTGSHQGVIAIKSGHLNFDKDILTGGNFEIEMSTITVTDLEGEYKGKLEGHLKSDDFFGVAKFPTASLSFTEVKSTGKNSYKVTGDITIKGKTESISFDFSVYGNKANASLKIDRTKFDVRYGSTSFFEGLKDKAIYDEFDLVIDLEF